MSIRAAFTGAVALLCGAGAIAHEGDPKALDTTPMYDGPGWSGGLRGDPPDFPSQGVTLLSWISIPDFGPGFTKANDCWGYVSPSGREYALERATLQSEKYSPLTSAREGCVAT